MSIEFISREVKRIQNKFAEKDPQALCHALKISQIFKPMGTGAEACKGFYIQQSKKQAIVINSDLPEELQRIILMHEIGHAILHRKLSSVKAFHDFTLFDEVSIYEYEANIFAADYLLADDEVLNLLNDDLFFFGAASRLNVPAELLDFKFRVLKRKGYKIIDPPIISNSDFLKKV
ncbi:MAG TPA: ImmA/IrrE family metallo-endopeptidase [Desulfitobacteriaceae bacterium]|nr:ImmA/IrrE family metallo-endopeptidase [Desulfitobacteriaceae bacterium]